MKRNGLIAVVCTLGVLVCTGCQTMPTNFEQTLQAVEKAAELAKEQGVSWYATARFNGRPGIGYTQKVFLDTGASVEVHFQGNAKDDADGD